MTSLRIADSLASLPAADWDALHDGDNPFVRHAFLSGLEQHGCLRPAWGWTPRHAALFDGDRLVAVAPGYLKTNSHGEFVFDHAWAHAYAQYGMDYYPKWLFAVPYSPVTGPRLLARGAAEKRKLAEALTKLAQASNLSSAHVNFLPEADAALLEEPWLARHDLQFHWRNTGGWHSFDDFLAALESKKRKNIRQERAQVRRAGVRFRIVHGDEASDDDLADIHAFYAATQTAYGNHPALTLDFVRHLARAMPRQLVLILASHQERSIAGALCLRGANTLYGRYWGAEQTLPGLHFETCYYQGIDYCLREGLTTFEPGAQGEHKVARGFLPVMTHSRHWLRDPRFAAALRDWCAEETRSVLRYRELVLAHSPYRDPHADPLAGR